MAKNLQVKLTFLADTKAAQQQLAQLQQTLSNVAATPVVGSGLKHTTAELQEATIKATELKIALHNATNIKTGKLNFGKFSQELTRNKMTLQQYAMQLQKLGPQGVQAFSQLATAIRQSEAPLVQLQGKMAALGQTFMNTIKWTISSSLIQGVTSAFTSTIDYAKDLNKVLTDIRIVTGKSMNDMSKFAQEVNKTAKALSTTTKEYAEASLIFFQQGLSDSEVAERTETTLKLAKVVGVEAQTASDWMTAIWNNFDDGSRSLENYADVLAKLGAATASSADEIAGGLEKFAAVADTVGLSYEYAASALATITAETRQSEDVVGTALKTIFARIENLNLGETLDDGTTMGKYSEALAKVGVSIKDSNGQLKEMDNILSELGAQWQILSKDEQVALAQSVAGIRQYNQFIALMDNWDVMEKNVELSKEANGALEEQHKIWATGIEGATSRVQEELNEIKNSLLDEDDLLPFLNVAEGFLDLIGDLIDSLGGLPGLLSIIASIGLQIWGPQAASMLQSMVNGVKSLYGGLSGKTAAARSNAITESSLLERSALQNSGLGNEEAAVTSRFAEQNTERIIQTEQNQKNLNVAYRETLSLLEQIIEARQKEAISAARNADQALDDMGNQKDRLVALNTNKNVDMDEVTTELEKAGQYKSKVQTFDETNDSIETIGKKANDIRGRAKSVGAADNKQQLEMLKKQESAYDRLQSSIKNYNNTAKQTYKTEADRNKAMAKAEAKVRSAAKSFKDQSKVIEVGKNATAKYAKQTGIASEEVEKVVTSSENYEESILNQKQAVEEGDKAQENYNKTMENGLKAGQSWSTTFVNTMQGVASMAAGLQMITGAFDSLTDSIADGNVGFSEILSFITSIGFAIPMAINGFKTFADTLKSTKIVSSILAKLEKKRADEATANALKHKAAGEIEQNTDRVTMLGKIGKWFAEGPWGWAIAAIAIAAIAAIGIGIGAGVVNAKQQEKQKEEQEEEDINTAKKTIEAAEGWNEEADAMDELIAKHKELKEANDQTIKGQKALAEAQQAVIEQVPKLIEKYEEFDKVSSSLGLAQQIANLQAAAAIGDVEQVEKITNEIDRLITESMVGENGDLIKGKKASAARTATAMFSSGADNGNHKELGNGRYQVAVGGAGGGAGASKLVSMLGDGARTETNFWGQTEARFELDTTDANEFVAKYETMQKFVKEMEEFGRTNDKTYKQVKELLSSSAEAYGELKEIADSGVIYELQNQAYNLDTQLSDVSSYEEYQRVQKEFLKNVKNNTSATEEQAKSWLRNQKAISTYAALENKLIDLRNNKNQGTLADSVERFVNEKNLTEEQLTAFLKIDLDKNSAQETWDDLIEFNLGQQESDKWKKSLDEIQDAAKNLKANGTAEDYQKVQEAMTWGENGVIKFSQFISKTYAEQVDYLNNLQIEHGKNQVETLKAGLTNLYTAYSEAVAAGNFNAMASIEAQIEAQKIAIGLAEKSFELAKKTQAQELRNRKKKLKDLADEVDPYYELDIAANNLSKTMEEVAASKEQAYGKRHQQYIQAEIKGLNAENAILERRIALSKDLQEQNKKDLAAQAKKVGKSLEFDENNNLVNYNEIKMAYQQGLASRLKYGEDSDEYKDFLAESEAFDKAFEDYQNNLTEAEEATARSAEIVREILDKQLEDIEYQVNVEIEINELEIKRLEYLLKSFDDPLYNSEKKIQLLSQQAQKYQENITTNKDAIAKILEGAGATDEQIKRYFTGENQDLTGLELTTQQIEAITQYTDGIYDNQEALEEVNDTIRNSLMETFEAWQEKMENVGARFDSLGSIVGNLQNIIDIVGKGFLGISEEQRQKLEELQLESAKGRLSVNKAKLDATEYALYGDEASGKKGVSDIVEEMEKKGLTSYKDEDGKEQTLEWWQQQEFLLTESLHTRQEEFTNSWAEALQTAADIFQAQMDRAFDNLDDELAGTYGSLDELQKAYDQDITASERYLDGGEKLYELSKLNRKIQKDINTSTNSKAQKELADLQAIITAYQADGLQMSKYELDALQKKYDLKLAEIALEESQNAKSQVRLSRDSQGNFSYVYSADETKTLEAEQKYEDQVEASRKLGEDQTRELTQAIIANRQAMVEELRNIRISDYESTEEYQQALVDATKFYQDQETYLLDEYNKAIGRSQLVYAQDFASYDSWSGKKLDTAKLLKEKLGDEENAIGINTFGFVENYGKYMEEMVGDMKRPAYAAEELVKVLGDGKTAEAGKGYYNQTLANTAAWVTGMGASMQTAAGSFSLVIGTDEEGNATGIKGLIATLGDGTSTGLYYDVLGNLNTFVGTYDPTTLTWTGLLEKAGQSFTLISAGATTLLETLGVGVGDGNLLDKIVIVGNTFVGAFNGTIAGVTFSPISDGASALAGILGNKDDAKTWLGKINQNLTNWEIAVDDIFELAGIDIENFSKTTSDVFGDIWSEIEIAKDDLSEYKKAANEAFTLNVEEQKAWDAKQKEIEDNKKLINGVYSSLADLKTDYAGKNGPDIEIKVEVPGLEELKELIAQLEKLQGMNVTNPAGPTGPKYEIGDSVSTKGNVNTYSVTGTDANKKATDLKQTAEAEGKITDYYYGKGSNTHYYKVGNTWYRQQDLEDGSELIGKKMAFSTSGTKRMYKEENGQLVQDSRQTAEKYDIVGDISEAKTWNGHMYYKIGSYWYNASGLMDATMVPKQVETKKQHITQKGDKLNLTKLYNEAGTLGELEKYLWYVNKGNGNVTLGEKAKYLLKYQLADYSNKHKQLISRTANPAIDMLVDNGKLSPKGTNETATYSLPTSLTIVDSWTQSDTGETYYQLDPNWAWGGGEYGDWGLWLKESELKKLGYPTKFDTGGYTGDWGPEGRLAMLHQKEIVLNAHDTENFLAAINIVRDISDQIEKNAIAMQYSASLGRVNAVYSGGLNSLQQDVTIHAEFPSVTDHNEIEIALADLVNQAAQFANRKF